MCWTARMRELSKEAVRSAMTYAESWLGYRQSHLRVPGVQAAALVGDELVLSRAFGSADVEAAVALTEEHLFRVASHSKTFTATAVLRLGEQGTLRLDDRAGRWLPFLEEAGSPARDVTLRELLSH